MITLAHRRLFCFIVAASLLLTLSFPWLDGTHARAVVVGSASTNGFDWSRADERGAAGLAQSIKRLGIVASVLHTGAHPDDEDSALLAYLARGRQARTAYLSLTRGDGGQNLIGPELGEALGVIRTE